MVQIIGAVQVCEVGRSVRSQKALKDLRLKISKSEGNKIVLVFALYSGVLNITRQGLFIEPCRQSLLLQPLGSSFAFGEALPGAGSEEGENSGGCMPPLCPLLLGLPGASLIPSTC